MSREERTESGYVLAETVFFNPADTTIINIRTRDTITLGITAGRLLQVILDSGHQVLTKEYLLERVWDDNGLTGSGSSLNQYLSILRRSLKAMELDEVIITIPKTGVFLSEGIKVTPPQSHPGEEKTPDSGEPSGKNKFPYAMLTYLTCILGSATFVFFTVYILYFKESFVQKDTHLLTRIDSCNVYYLKTANKKDSNKIINLISEFMKSKNLTCDAYRDIYFNYFPSFGAHSYDRMLFTYCNLSAEGTASACSNFYEYSRAVN